MLKNNLPMDGWKVKTAGWLAVASIVVDNFTGTSILTPTQAELGNFLSNTLFQIAGVLGGIGVVHKFQKGSDQRNKRLVQAEYLKKQNLEAEIELVEKKNGKEN